MGRKRSPRTGLRGSRRIGRKRNPRIGPRGSPRIGRRGSPRTGPPKVPATGQGTVVVGSREATHDEPRSALSLSENPMILRIRTLSAAGVLAILAGATAMAPSALAADLPANAATRQFVQRAFPTPEDAANALAEAMRSGELRQIFRVLGRGSGKLIHSGDPVTDKTMRDNFVAAYAKSVKIEKEGDAKATLLLGENDWPFPFPLVKGPEGWSFDAKAGADEIVNRRIGRNELAAMQVCLAYVDAQREYAVKDRDNNGLLEYAQKLKSTPGTHDGLYWEAKDGEPASPFGPLAARARKQGYGKSNGDSEPYHGYFYKILTAQGPDAAGGAYNYIVNGKMIGGFALLAYPARWGASGVMSFACSHEGVVYEKNLGPNTAAISAAMTQYNPDSSWTKPSK
jgi:Protein of unknown function (DUF2950)